MVMGGMFAKMKDEWVLFGQISLAEVMAEVIGLIGGLVRCRISFGWWGLVGLFGLFGLFR